MGLAVRPAAVVAFFSIAEKKQKSSPSSRWQYLDWRSGVIEALALPNDLGWEKIPYRCIFLSIRVVWPLRHFSWLPWRGLLYVFAFKKIRLRNAPFELIPENQSPHLWGFILCNLSLMATLRPTSQTISRRWLWFLSSGAKICLIKNEIKKVDELTGCFSI